MCGICGVMGGPLPLAEEKARLMADLMAHRGPDDSGLARVRAGEAVGFFGHRRLSILDLSTAGHQPMSRGRWTLTYNGEIYNSRELRAELETAGCRFESTCDTEVICWGLQTWGLEGTVSRLEGMFAFAACDGESVCLVRDRMGIKPLFYFADAGRLYFASELGALIAQLPDRPAVCRNALRQYLMFGYVPSPLTIYDGVEKILPGEIVKWSLGKVERKRYWRLNPGEAGSHSGSFHEAVEEGEALLKEAVRERLLSDVPLGLFLSGGIDSSLVCALAYKAGPERMKTFTIGFEHGEYDESQSASAIARHLGTEHTCVYMTSEDMLQIVPRIPALFGEPFADASALPTFLLSGLTKRTVTVALSGDGGDEQFFGYRRHLGYLALRKYEMIPAFLRRALGGALHAVFGDGRIGRHGKALGYRSFAEATTLLVGHFHRVRFKQLAGSDPDFTDWRYCHVSEMLSENGLGFERKGPLLDLMFYLPDDILTKVDRTSMAHSLEVRVPLLCHRFVEFAHRLPHKYKYDGMVQKRILREILNRHLPRELWERPKQGFGAPLDHWFRDELKEPLCDLLSFERLQRQGCLNPAFCKELVESHLSGAKDNQYTLWNLFVLQRWAEENGVSLPPLWWEAHGG